MAVLKSVFVNVQFSAGFVGKWRTAAVGTGAQMRTCYLGVIQYLIGRSAVYDLVFLIEHYYQPVSHLWSMLDCWTRPVWRTTKIHCLKYQPSQNEKMKEIWDFDQ